MGTYTRLLTRQSGWKFTAKRCGSRPNPEVWPGGTGGRKLLPELLLEVAGDGLLAIRPGGRGDFAFLAESLQQNDNKEPRKTGIDRYLLLISFLDSCVPHYVRLSKCP
jgi:hypothetical protein